MNMNLLMVSVAHPLTLCKLIFQGLFANIAKLSADRFKWDAAVDEMVGEAVGDLC